MEIVFTLMIVGITLVWYFTTLKSQELEERCTSIDIKQLEGKYEKYTSTFLLSRVAPILLCVVAITGIWAT